MLYLLKIFYFRSILMGYYDRTSSLDMNYSEYIEKQAILLKDISGSIEQNTNQIKNSMVCM
jgi:hypothetical protein